MFGHAPIAASPFGALGESTPTIVLAGIASTSAIGDLTTAYHLTASSVSEADGIGSATVYYNVAAAGVAEADGIGGVVVVPIISASGVAEADGIGDITASYIISPYGIVNPIGESSRIGGLTTTYLVSLASIDPPLAEDRWGDESGVVALDVIPGPWGISPYGIVNPIGESSRIGGLTVFYIVRGLSMGSEAAIGSMTVTGDQTLTFSGEERAGLAFPGIAEIVETPGFRPFENGESEVLPFGGIVAWKASTGTAATRVLAQKPTATNLYDIAGVVAGMTVEGENVSAGSLGFLYTRGMAQALVVGHASLAAGAVVEAVAGQYHLQYASSQTATNQFVIHESHTSAGTVALKMVNVKVSI